MTTIQYELKIDPPQEYIFVNVYNDDKAVRKFITDIFLTRRYISTKCAIKSSKEETQFDKFIDCFIKKYSLTDLCCYLGELIEDRYKEKIEISDNIEFNHNTIRYFFRDYTLNCSIKILLKPVPGNFLEINNLSEEKFREIESFIIKEISKFFYIDE